MMQTIFSERGLAVAPEPAVWALGMFDGVHKGHAALIDIARKKALELSVKCGVFTFDLNPLGVIKPEAVPLSVVSLEGKLQLLASAGVEITVVEQFDGDFAAMSPKAFASEVLKRRLKARHVVVGYDYSFGSGGQGNTDTLVQLGPELGFGITVVPQVQVDGSTVSSSAIRAAIAAGDVERARAMLGRPHFIEGIVEHGRGVGASMGIPTANIALPEDIAIPEVGVYACFVRSDDGQRWPALCNIGLRPTFHDEQRGIKCEAHIIGASMELYGRCLRVEFIRRLRGEAAFASPEALMAQIRFDTAQALKILGTEVL